MALELEGNLSLERAHTRRWVSIIAVVIPVAAFVLGGAWFIRAYIVPPTVAIHTPTLLADAPPPPPAVPKRAMVEGPKPPLAVAAPAETPVKETSVLASAVPASAVPVSALPMFATLTAIPPSFPNVGASFPNAGAPPAYADPAQDAAPAAAPMTVAEPAEVESSEPLAGPVPLPRSKRQAALSSAIPLPRPKPADAAPEPDLPAVDRHGVN